MTAESLGRGREASEEEGSVAQRRNTWPVARAFEPTGHLWYDVQEPGDDGRCECRRLSLLERNDGRHAPGLHAAYRPSIRIHAEWKSAEWELAINKGAPEDCGEGQYKLS